ncbi:MAG: diguanylate cyclase [Gemmatimonadetes bacterium]|nr:diguanylate cyclase [Gemmatimonadota bacterium]
MDTPYPKVYDGYRSFQYLEAGRDYKSFPLAVEIDRVPAAPVPLSDDQERHFERLLEELVLVSLHEHLCLFPDPVSSCPEYVREGRIATAFEAIASSHWDCVFDNLLDGICRIHSKSGWKWTEVLHDLGMRLCDLAHQDGVSHCLKVDDLLAAKAGRRLAWVASIEGAAMIENELDRIDLLFGFGVRALGIAYSEGNALGAGLKEPRDGGLTAFGRKAVERMNKLGMLIDCSHCGDRTTLDTIEVSEAPVVLSHIGARALWDSIRLAPDEVLEACARSGGVIGIEAAPHTTITPTHPRHGLESFMEHFEYVRGLVGIDHVGFGPDTVYGDHVGLHRTYASALSIADSRRAPSTKAAQHPKVDFVAGIENPTEGSTNILRWLVRSGYSDEDIAKVMGGNALRVLRQVWP